MPDDLTKVTGGGPEAAWDQPGVYDALDQLSKDYGNYVGGAAAMHNSLAKLCDKCTKAVKDPRLSGYAGLLKKIGDAHRAAHTNFTRVMESALSGLAGVIHATDRSDPDDPLKPENGGYSFTAKPQGERSDGRSIAVNPNHPHNPASARDAVTPSLGDNTPGNLFPSQEQNINSAKACMAALCKSLLNRGITPPEKMEDLAQLPLTAQEQEYLVKGLVASNEELRKEWKPELHANLRKAGLDALADYVRGTKVRKLL